MKIMHTEKYTFRKLSTLKLYFFSQFVTNFSGFQDKKRKYGVLGVPKAKNRNRILDDGIFSTQNFPFPICVFFINIKFFNAEENNQNDVALLSPVKIQRYVFIDFFFIQFFVGKNENKMLWNKKELWKKYLKKQFFYRRMKKQTGKMKKN